MGPDQDEKGEQGTHIVEKEGLELGEEESQ